LRTAHKARKANEDAAQESTKLTPPIVSHTCGELVAEKLAMAIAAAAPNATSRRYAPQHPTPRQLSLRREEFALDAVCANTDALQEIH